MAKKTIKEPTDEAAVPETAAQASPLEALLEAYRKQSPAKYEAKKEELLRKLEANSQ